MGCHTYSVLSAEALAMERVLAEGSSATQKKQNLCSLELIPARLTSSSLLGTIVKQQAYWFHSPPIPVSYFVNVSDIVNTSKQPYPEIMRDYC
jgi:hypothetical protein